MTYQEPSGGEQRVSFIAPAPLKPELTFLGDVLSKERGERQSGDFNWIFLQAGREFSSAVRYPSCSASFSTSALKRYLRGAVFC